MFTCATVHIMYPSWKSGWWLHPMLSQLAHLCTLTGASCPGTFVIQSGQMGADRRGTSMLFRITQEASDSALSKPCHCNSNTYSKSIVFKAFPLCQALWNGLPYLMTTRAFHPLFNRGWSWDLRRQSNQTRISGLAHSCRRRPGLSDPRPCF